MNMNYKIKRYLNAKGKNCVSVGGINFETEVEILKENNYALLCKWCGGNHWVALGTYEYKHPSFLIFKKVSKDEIKDTGTGRELEYDRKTKKEVFKKVCEEFDKLGQEAK